MKIETTEVDGEMAPEVVINGLKLDLSDIASQINEAADDDVEDVESVLQWMEDNASSVAVILSDGIAEAIAPTYDNAVDGEDAPSADDSQAKLFEGATPPHDA